MPTRHRDQNVDTTFMPHSLNLWTPGEGYNPEPVYQWSDYALTRFPKFFSRMTDVYGNAGGQNPVEHFEISSTMSNLNTFFRSSSSGVVPARFAFEGVWFPLAPLDKYFDDWPWLPVTSAASISDWSVEAFNAFHDQVPVKVSLPNFIYELKDMKSMIPSIDRKSLTKTASNNFLAFEFGVQPFISDVKAILGLADSTAKRLQHLIDTAGKATNLSFNRTKTLLPEELGLFTKSLTFPYLGIGYRVEFKMLSAKTDFHIGGKLYQDLRDLKDALSQLKALSAAGGFNHPARVIWNAIPYSFVVDWFFHVGKLLDSLSIQPFGGTYDVSDVMWSIKTQATYYASQLTDVTYGNATDRQPLGIVNAKYYSRKAGFPMSSLFLTDATLSPTQLALSAAMLEQRRR